MQHLFCIFLGKKTKFLRKLFEIFQFPKPVAKISCQFQFLYQNRIYTYCDYIRLLSRMFQLVSFSVDKHLLNTRLMQFFSFAILCQISSKYEKLILRFIVGDEVKLNQFILKAIKLTFTLLRIH